MFTGNFRCQHSNREKQSMFGKKLIDLKSTTDRVAAENCYVEQILNSIFEHVTSESVIENRSDHDEIIRFSSSLLENELLFGSPSEEVLDRVNRRIMVRKNA